MNFTISSNFVHTLVQDLACFLLPLHAHAQHAQHAWHTRTTTTAGHRRSYKRLRFIILHAIKCYETARTRRTRRSPRPGRTNIAARRRRAYSDVRNGGEKKTERRLRATIWPAVRCYAELKTSRTRWTQRCELEPPDSLPATAPGGGDMLHAEGAMGLGFGAIEGRGSFITARPG